MRRALFLVVCLVAAATIGYFWGKKQEEPIPVERVVEVKSSPNVIVALHRLARLEGASLHLERVIDLKEKQSRFFGLVEAEDAILLVAAGDVTAGVDLSQMTPEDIVVDEAKKSVKVTLPRAYVFTSRVDNERTYVHTRNTDMLAERRTELEAEARREAERGFESAAREAGIEKTAETSVAKTVYALITSLGFTEVEVVFRDLPPPAEAK